MHVVYLSIKLQHNLLTLFLLYALHFSKPVNQLLVFQILFYERSEFYNIPIDLVYRYRRMGSLFKWRNLNCVIQTDITLLPFHEIILEDNMAGDMLYALSMESYTGHVTVTLLLGSGGHQGHVMYR